MNLSTAEIRETFKQKLDLWGSDNKHADQIPLATESLLNDLQKRIHLLREDFKQRSLNTETATSVNNSFTHMNTMLSEIKSTCLNIDHQNFTEIVLKLKSLYVKDLIPLFNLLLRLENDYTSLTTNEILQKGKRLLDLDERIRLSKIEKENVKKRIFDLHRKEKYIQILKKIKRLELERKLVKLTLHHDKLNLYYFSHHRPPELNEIKALTDALRHELMQLEEIDK